MAGILAQSPVSLVGVGVENLDLGGCSRKAWRNNRVNFNLRATATPCSSSNCGNSLQSLAGFMRSGAVDAIALRSGRDIQSNISCSVVGGASSGADVSTEFEEEEFIISAEEEVGLSNGHKNLSPSNVETSKSSKNFSSDDDHVRSRSFNDGVDSYRSGSGRSSDIAASTSFRPGPIPASIAAKKGGRSVFVERWTPAGPKVSQVKSILERLERAEPTDEGVKAAMDGWDAPMDPRDITSAMSNMKWKTALAFFNWLRSEAYELNVVMYNVALGRFRAGRVWNVAEEFAEQMIKDGVMLDNYTYSTLISCSLQCGLPEESLKWFDKMDQAGCVPDEVTYSNMALVYSRLGRFNDAVDLYERLRRTGWKPDKISFGTMVNVYSRGGNYFKASAVIREMQAAGIQPEAVVYNTLIKHFGREGKTGQAKRVFQDMEKAGVKPTEYTLSLMIDVHGRAGESNEAFQLFTRMKEDKLPLDVVVYNSLLKMCAEERLVEEAEGLLAAMIGRGLIPDIVTYKSMINLHAKEGRIKDAEKFANRMVEVGLKLDVIVYSCLIKACGITKDLEGAAAFLDQMLAEGCAPDDKCCGVLLSLMSSCETMEDRSIVLDCLRKAKPTLSGVVDVLLEEELRLGALEELVQGLMFESEPDSQRPFCNALVDICWTLGKKDHAAKLMYCADSLNVYPGGLRTKTEQIWILHLRSLSFNSAECCLHSWLHDVREQLEQGEELPETLAIETGAGRNRGEVTRMFNVILTKLQDMGAPFEPTPERMDWLTANGLAFKEWLIASPGF